MLQIIKKNSLSIFVFMVTVFFPFYSNAAIQSPLSAGSLLTVFGALLVVLALIMLIYLITKSRFKVKKLAPFQVSIVSRSNIDSKHQIVLLKVDDEYLLIGIGDLSVIKELGTKEGIDFKSVVDGLGEKNSPPI